MKRIFTILTIALLTNANFGFATGGAKIISKEILNLNGVASIDVKYIFADTLKLIKEPVFKLFEGCLLANYTSLTGKTPVRAKLPG